MTRSFKVLAGGAVLVVAFMVAGVATVMHYEDQEDKEDARVEEQNRVDRSQEACKRDNRLTTQRRDLERERVAEYAMDFFDATPEEAASLVPSSPQFELFVQRHLPYRQCSEACVIADLDADLENCPPASNEEGDP